MKMIHLCQLSPLDGKNVYEMLQNIGFEENAFTNPVNGMSYENFENWLVQQDKWSRSEELPQGYVGQTIFWLYDNSIPVGIGKIRHALTDHSRRIGGNIGYAISSTYRGKGYGTIMLELLLDKAKEMNLKETLLTVEKNNLASKRVIEKNGGKLIDETAERWFFSFD